MSLDLRPNRKYPNLPSITNDPASHRDALRAVTEALSIGQRRTADILSSFIRVSDLVDLGLIELSGGSFASAPPTYTPSAHSHLLADVTDAGALAALNTLAHVATTGLGNDDHTQYIRVDGTRAFTGTQTTRALLPNVTATQDLGSTTLRYRFLYANQLNALNGTLTTLTTTSTNMIALRGGTGTGTKTVSLTSSGGSSIHTAIAALNAASGGSSTLTISGLTNTFIGRIDNASGSGTASATIGGTGNFVSGNVGGAGAIISVGFADEGNFIQGQVPGGSISSLSTYGCFVQGFAAATGVGPGSISAAGTLGFIGGAFVQGATIDGTMYGTADGVFVQGYALANCTIGATGSGALARGAAADGDIKATAAGATAFGITGAGFDITASGVGALAAGDSTTGAITAAGIGSVQLGPGVNNENATVQIGNAGLRIKGTVGPPGTKQNGDHWMGGTGNAFVIVRSNAKDVQLNVGQAYTVNTYTTRRNLPNSATVTLAEVADVLATLINDLKTTGHLN